jgi:hypothetical protein
LSVGTLSGGAVTSELVVPVSTGTPVELVPPGRATTSVGVGVSKELLHPHPHTVGTVVAAGESPAAGTHTHAHAPHCLQQSPCLRVSKHAHAALPLACPSHAAAPRVGVAEDIGGQCVLSTSDTRGGYGLSSCEEMYPREQSSRTVPPRTHTEHHTTLGGGGAPLAQTRCRAPRRFRRECGPSTGVDSIQESPSPTPSLVAAPVTGACSVRSGGWGADS